MAAGAGCSRPPASRTSARTASAIARRPTLPIPGVPTKVGMKLTDRSDVHALRPHEDKPVRDAAELVASRRQAITGARQLAEAAA